MRVGIAGYGVVGKTRHLSIEKNTTFKVTAVSEKNNEALRSIPSNISIYDDYKSSYDAASKGDKGEPISVDGGDATALDKALLYYNNQTVVDSVMKMIQQLESGKRSARRFIAKIYFDSRACLPY